MMWTWLTKCTTEISVTILASLRQPSACCGPAATPNDSLVDDIGTQSPDPGDLDLDLVARLHPERRLAPQTDTVRRARCDDIAWLKPGDGREILDDRGEDRKSVV